RRCRAPPKLLLDHPDDEHPGAHRRHHLPRNRLADDIRRHLHDDQGRPDHAPPRQHPDYDEQAPSGAGLGPRAAPPGNGGRSGPTPRSAQPVTDTPSLDRRLVPALRSTGTRRLVGLKGYVTNIPATVMWAAEVLSSYHDVGQVEQSFRMNTSDLQARPIWQC